MTAPSLQLQKTILGEGEGEKGGERKKRTGRDKHILQD